MKLRNPSLLKLVGLILGVLIRLWMSTVRLRIHMDDWRTDPDSPRCLGPHVHAFWHEGILALNTVSYQNPIYVLISQHADGELIAQVIAGIGLKTVRGSTTRGGGQAVVELLQRSKTAHLAITPDGPKGPRRQAQRGTVFLASRSGLPVVPYGLAFSRAWRAKSWDRFAIPLPFSTVYGVTGPSLSVPLSLDRAAQDQFLQELQRRLDAATAAAEQWCERHAGRVSRGS